jgi:hypothetical protein
MGGSGKTTLAAMLCHLDDIQGRFCDGILWVKLGHELCNKDAVSLESWLRRRVDDLIRVFHEEAQPSLTLDGASAHLRSLLAGRSVLMVLDDAWRAEHVKCFLPSSNRSRALITSREALSFKKWTDEPSINVGLLTTSQALSLFVHRMERDLAEAERETALEVASAVSFLPLALDLVASRVAEGLPWNKLLTDLNEQASRSESRGPASVPEGSGSEATRAYISLDASMNLSLESLSPELSNAFARLGVLSEGENVTPDLARTLWDLPDEKTAFDRLQGLHQKALLNKHHQEGAQEYPAYSMHGIVHRFARRKLTAPSDLGGLGCTLRQAHQELLRCYRQRMTDNHWTSLPKDGYIDEFLVHHLEFAGQHAAIHELLAGDTGRQWSERRSRSGLISDFVRAKRLVTFDSDLAMSIRYAVFEGIAQRLYEEMPVAVLPAVMRSQSPDTELLEALVGAMQGNNVDRVQTYLGVLSQTDAEPVVTESILDVAAAVRDSEERANTVMQLMDVGRLSSGALSKARRVVWRACFELDSSEKRRELLDSLFPLSRDELVQFRQDVLELQAQDPVMKRLGCTFDFFRAVDIWVYVCDSYSASIQNETWKLLWEHATRAARPGEAIGYLFPRLPDDLKDAYLDEVWDRLRSLPNWESARYYPAVVRPLLPYMLESHVREVWERAKAESTPPFKHDFGEYRGHSLALILPHLSHEFVSARLSDIKKQISVIRRSEADYLDQAIFYLWVGLAEHLTGDEQEEAYREAWKWATGHISSEQWLRSAIERIDPMFAWKLWKQTVQNLHENSDQDWPTGLQARRYGGKLSTLTNQLPLNHVEDAKRDCLVTLPQHLPLSGVVRILDALARRLPQGDAAGFWLDLIDDSLADGFETFSEYAYSPITIGARLVKHAPPDAKHSAAKTVLDALDAMDPLEDPGLRPRVLTSVVQSVPQSMQSSVWLEGWDGALQRGDVWIMQNLISQLVDVYPNLNDEQRSRLEGSDWQANVWRSEDWDRLLLDRRWTGKFAQGLAILLRHAPSEFRLRIWHPIKDHLDRKVFDLVLISLLPDIPVDFREDVVSRIVARADHRCIADKLNILAARWPEMLLWGTWRSILSEVNDANSYKYGAWLAGLTNRLSVSHARQAWQLFCAKTDQVWFMGEVWQQIALSLVGRLPSADVVWAYQRLQKSERVDHYRAHSVKVALLRRFSRRQLTACFEESIDPVPQDVFTCSLGKYVRYGGPLYHYQDEDLGGYYGMQVDARLPEKQQQLVNALGYASSNVACVFACLWSLLSWIRKPFQRIEEYMEAAIHAQIESIRNVSRDRTWGRLCIVAILYAPVWLLHRARRLCSSVLWQMGSVISHIRQTVCTSRNMQAMICAASKQVFAVLLMSYAIGRDYAVRKNEARHRLKQEISSTGGRDRLHRLVALRPLLQRAGGRDLRSEVQAAYADAYTWWQQAIRLSMK